MTTRFRRIGCLACFSLTLLLAPALACDPVKGIRKVRISVVIILATEKDNKIDKKLACIAREVRKTNPKLTGFRLDTLSCKSLTVGTADKFDLVEGKKASVTVQDAADKMDRVRLKVAPPSMGEITYSTPCGKFLPILTPLRTKKGEVVLIAIRVQPCHGNADKK